MFVHDTFMNQRGTLEEICGFIPASALGCPPPNTWRTAVPMTLPGLIYLGIGGAATVLSSAAGRGRTTSLFGVPLCSSWSVWGRRLGSEVANPTDAVQAMKGSLLMEILLH